MWARAALPFVAVIAESPGAEYVRGRAPQLASAGVPMQVGVFQAMAEYVAANPTNQKRRAFSPCPACGRPATVYTGRMGWPDMAHCERCDKTHVVKDSEAGEATEPQAVELNWWDI